MAPMYSPKFIGTPFLVITSIWILTEEKSAAMNARKQREDLDTAPGTGSGEAPIENTPEVDQSVPGTDKRKLQRTLIATALGSIVEYYDFAIYGYVATVLSTIFFVQSDPEAALLSTLATFAAAFVTRPLGGIIFGYLGDRVGRRSILATIILGMSVATFAIGLLPTYSAIGLGAPILLITLRCLQGISAGGEFGGALTFIGEHAPKRRRALWCSSVQIGALLGALTAAAVATLLTGLLTDAQMSAWGWRIAFLIALPLGWTGFYIRRRLDETPYFQEIKERTERPSQSGGTNADAKSVSHRSRAQDLIPVVQTVGLSLILFTAYYITTVYAAIFLQTEAGFDSTFATSAVTISIVACAILTPLCALLADRYSRKALFTIAALAMMAVAYPAFELMLLGVPWLAVVGTVTLMTPQAFLGAAAYPMLVEVFRTTVRFRGLALGYNLSSIIGGGLSPYLSTWLISQTGDPHSPALVLVAAGIIAVVAVWTVRDRRGIPLLVD